MPLTPSRQCSRGVSRFLSAFHRSVRAIFKTGTFGRSVTPPSLSFMSARSSFIARKGEFGLEFLTSPLTACAFLRI
jgi:hypothetical protein